MVGAAAPGGSVAAGSAILQAALVSLEREGAGRLEREGDHLSLFYSQLAATGKCVQLYRSKNSSKPTIQAHQVHC